MANDEIADALVDAQQSVAYVRRALVWRLQAVVTDAPGERQPMPAKLLDQIADFWRYDPAHAGMEFGQYVYSLITGDPTKFPDKFMGYEWNGDEAHPQVDILIRSAAT